MRTSSLSIAAFVLLVPSLVTFSRPGQQQSPVISDPELKIMTVTVRNGAGHYVMGVPREAFELTDEKERRPIEFFENADTPVSIGILIDTSGSMQSSEVKEIARPGPIGEAISRFIELSNDKDEYFLMAFDRTPHLLSDWTSGADLLARKTDIGPAGHDTALYDACVIAIEKLQTARYEKRALILISDGQDNLSRHTFYQLRDVLKNSDVVLYGIGISQGSDVGSSLGLEGAGIMDELAEITGGESLFSHDQKHLIQAIDVVSIQLRHQYRIGFRVAITSSSGKWRRLRLKIIPRPSAPKEFAKLTTRTRQGYYTR